MKKIRVTVIGTITQDTISFPDGRKRRGYGGILYNILPLAKLAPENIKVTPVCNLGSNIYDKIISSLKGFRNIDLKGITRVEDKNNHVFLHYNRGWDKEEVLKNLVPEIDFSQVLPFLSCDLLLINFISGFDISLDSLKKIRKKSSSLIFMDVHSLLLGRREDGKRFFRVPGNWEEYLEIADIIQMNYKEMQVLSGRNLDSYGELDKFSRKILSLGPESLIVTKGKKGALIYSRKKNKITSHKIESFGSGDTIDPTGCGDIFSSGFILFFIKTQEVKLSAEFADFLAGMNSRFSGGVERFVNLFP